MATIIAVERTTICPQSSNKFMKIIMLIGGLILLYIFLCMNSKNKLSGGSVTKTETFILYYVEWCPHCKVVKPEWEKLEKDHELKMIEIKKVNCEENEDIVNELGIEGFPTILYTKNGKVEPYNGEREYKEFKQFLLSKK